MKIIFVAFLLVVGSSAFASVDRSEDGGGSGCATMCPEDEDV